jgi:SAM-dependent methyltransferase
MGYKEDILKLEEVYRESYNLHKYSPASLLWYTDKMNIRYDNLIKMLRLDNPDLSFLDIGCGFGDINAYLNRRGYADYYYTGIDITKEFIEVAEEKYGNVKIQFINAEFLNTDFSSMYDYVLMSGIFNYRLNASRDNNYDFMFDSIKKAFDICNKAIAFNFIIDKVDYKNENVAYHSPTKIIDYLYTLSKRLILCNDCMPFECTCILYKEDQIDFDSMLFKEYIEEHKNYFDDGTFVIKKGKKQ